MYLPLKQIVFVILSISKLILTNEERIIWDQVCQGSDGNIFLSRKDTSILTINDDSKSVTFVDDISEYKFKCNSDSDTDHYPSIYFEGIKDRNQDHEVNINKLAGQTTRILQSNMLMSRNDFNRKNMTVSCKGPKGNICSTTLILINRVLEKECEFNNTLHCDIDVINSGRQVWKSSKEIPEPRFPQGEGVSRISLISFQPKKVIEHIKYSIYVNDEVK